jgi:hydroxymethylpyrimidine pyrophosphatase-like HAD family hydrolase
VPSDKVLTERTIRAVNDLRDAGIIFAISSSRPPRGLSMYIKPLKLTTPIAGFNGGMIVDPNERVLEERIIDDDITSTTIGFLDEHNVNAWIYRGQEWYVRDPDEPYVAHEAEVCGFQPLPMHTTFGADVSATNSSSYYLDITNPQANKGSVVDYLSTKFGVPASEIATIGDAQNDVAMFERSGLSIAMGNAEDDVKRSAREVTTSNEDDGFARAVERFILS